MMSFGIFPHICAAAVLAATILAAQAQDSGTAIRLKHAWSRATPPRARVAVAYLSVTNMSGHADRLVSANSDRAMKVEIHEARMDGGVMRMRPVAGGIVIEPGETVTFQPGGLHLMLTGLQSPLRKDETLKLVLRFETAGEISVEVPVLSIGAKAPGHANLAGEAMAMNMTGSVIAAV